MKRVPVTQHASLTSDRVPEFAGEREYLATGSVDDDGLLAPKLVTYESRPSRADLSAKLGDVCFARMQATRKVLRIDEVGAEAILSTGFAVLRPNPEYLYSGYLRSWVASDAFQFAKDRLCTGATQKAITNAKIKTLPILLPPLHEQKRIAGILDAADALRAKRREALAQLDTLLQSTFLGMFGEPVRSGWTMVTVETLASSQSGAIRTGPFGSQLLHSEFVDEGIRVLGIDNAVANEFREGKPRFITAQKYEELRRYTVRPRDVLITIMGTCGRCAVVPDGICTAINTKHLCCVTLDHGRCLPEFMHAYFLEHPIARRYLERSAKGAIMSGLNMGIIKALPIPVAPLDLQRRFAAIVHSVEQQKTRQRAHLAELDTLFASLQSRAFRGDL